MRSSTQKQSPWRPLAYLFAFVLLVNLLAVSLLTSFGAHWLFAGTWVGEFHDRVILPQLVEGVLKESVWLTLLVLLASLSVVSWPHLIIYQGVLWIAVCTTVFWIGYYQMWYYRPVASGILVIALGYALARYFWECVVGVFSIVGRRSFLSVQRFAKEKWNCCQRDTGTKEIGGSVCADDQGQCPGNHLAIDLYFDAIRALSFPIRSKGDQKALTGFWDRSGCGARSVSRGFWGGMFGWPADWYRNCGRGRGRVQDLIQGVWWGFWRIWAARRTPASLSVPWLREVLAAEEERRFAQLMEGSCAGEEWLQRFYEWAQVVELNIEYFLFDPVQHPPSSPYLVWATEKYDELSRVGLLAQLAVGNVSKGTGIADRWLELGKVRLRFIRKAMLLRAYALGWGNCVAEGGRQGSVQPGSGWDRELALVHAICKFQADWYEGRASEPSDLIHEVMELITRADREGVRMSPVVLWKAVEIACDIGDFQLAQELLLRPEIRKPSPVYEIGEARSALEPGLALAEKTMMRSAKLAIRTEGHLAWWAARGTEDPSVRMRAYRHAFGSFSEVGSWDLEGLRSHLSECAPAS